MPLQSRVNQYLGVNAHLQSYYQANTGWVGFHQAYIMQLEATLQEVLRPYGYLVDNTTSMQIKELPTDGEDSGRSHTLFADIGIRDFVPTEQHPPMIYGTGGVVALEMPIWETVHVDEGRFLRAIAIREMNPDDKRPGRIVTWLEVLSPSNKPGGSDYSTYLEKRISVIGAGINLIELDFIHWRGPVVAGLPRYLPNSRTGEHDPDAMPYYIAVTNPHPTIYDGKATIYTFSPSDAIPIITIPLARDEKVGFDFGDPYRKTFSADARAYLVDYEQLPEEFATYNKRDQGYIRALMRTVARHRDELDQGPFPVEDLKPSNGNE